MWSVPTISLLFHQVTVVRNLEAYGLDPCSVAATLQQRCQASTTVTAAPGLKDSLQVQIQGNQIHHLGRLLLGEHPPDEAETSVSLGKGLPIN